MNKINMVLKTIKENPTVTLTIDLDIIKEKIFKWKSDKIK